MQLFTDFLPNIKTLLQLFSTPPVALATPECIFSSLKRIKICLRSNTSTRKAERLGFDKQLTVEEITRVFITYSAREMQLPDWLKKKTIS